LDNYLENQCNTLGIKCIYTTNKTKLLASNVLNGIPILRVHKMLKQCNLFVATAIINYYTKQELDLEAYKVIEDYIASSNPNLAFKIGPPNKLFTDIFTNRKINYDSCEMTEFEIISINKKSFMNHETNSSTEIIIEEEDVLELDISIKPFNT